MKTVFKLVLLSILLNSSILTAQVPQLINFQGRVSVNGTNFDGVGQFRFALTDGGKLIPRPPLPPRILYETYWSHDGSSSGGSAPTSSVPVTVSKGLYSLMLGDTSLPNMTQSLPPSVFTNSPVYLRIWFDDGTNGLQRLTPDQRITATAYAFKAAGVDAGAITAEMIADGAIANNKIADGAVTGSKVQAGSLQLSQLDDGGSASYQLFQQAVQPFGGDTSLAFSELSPVGATNSISQAFALSINSTSFGTVVGFSGSEEISKPYSYVVQVQYSGTGVTTDSQLGLPATVSLTRNGRTTTLGGLVTACTLSGSSGAGRLYTVRIEPALAYLALTTDSRVNQSRTVPDVASALYQTVTGNAATLSLTGSHATRESLVQHAETDLNFFNRVLEYEGIFYFFNQRIAPPSLVLGDNASAYLSAPNSPFTYYGNTATNMPAASEYIRTFQKAVQQSTLKSTVSAYNFKTPYASLAGNAVNDSGVGENYEFGTPNATAAYDTTLAQLRRERQSVERALMAGSSTAPDLHAGYTFTLNDQSGSGVAGTYLVVSVRHAGFVRVTNGVSTCFYGNRFEVIPASLIYRPALATPKPKAQACTAVVTGPAGEEIFTDQYGRIKVQFHWDRYGQQNETSSAWIRVASPWAGKQWGVMFLPRIGQEVLVEFLQGDPDQPVVVGSLYNADMMPPYALPANQTVSTIKTRSSKAGTTANFNEIKFEDKKGYEALSITAEKDLNVTAKNDVSMAAGADMTISANTLQLSSSGGVVIGQSTNAAQSALDVSGTATIRSNLVVYGSISSSGPFYASGSLLAATSLPVSMVSVASVPANGWTKVGDIGTFTKQAGSRMEITFNGRLALGSWGAGATGADFELRVDNATVSSGRARATVATSDSTSFGVPATITGLFTGLSAGNHTVSIWVYSYYGTAGTAAVNPGNFGAAHLVIKEFK